MSKDWHYIPCRAGSFVTLSSFGCRVGLKAIQLKSSTYIAGADDSTRSSLLDVYHLEELPLHYLGIPLATERLRSSEFGIVSSLQSLPCNSLSYVRKIELIGLSSKGLNVFGYLLCQSPLIMDRIYSLCISLFGSSLRK